MTQSKARGERARSTVPHEAHAELPPRQAGADPVALLEQQAITRVSDLVPLRYGRMLVSPFTFYRGAALLMADDLGSVPNTGLYAQLCGDAHVSNFGLFASYERRLVFDVNDFDETLPGPFEWDLKRLSASIELAGRNNEFAASECRKVVEQTSKAYRRAMRDFTAMGELDLWYARLDVLASFEELKDALKPAAFKRMERTVQKSVTRDHRQAARKTTEVVDGRTRFRSDPPLLVPVRAIYPDQTEAELTAWVLLLEGRVEGDPLVLQAKEAQVSVLEHGLARVAEEAVTVGAPDDTGHIDMQAEFDCQGERVVQGQRTMQAVGDLLLGWRRGQEQDGLGIDYYVRQLRDWKGSFDLARFTPESLQVYGKYCAWILARSHARSGDRVAIDAYLRKGRGFDVAMADFAVAYADRNEGDYAALQQAAAEGRVTVVRDI